MIDLPPPSLSELRDIHLPSPPEELNAWLLAASLLVVILSSLMARWAWRRSPIGRAWLEIEVARQEGIWTGDSALFARRIGSILRRHTVRRAPIGSSIVGDQWRSFLVDRGGNFWRESGADWLVRDAFCPSEKSVVDVNRLAKEARAWVLWNH